MSVARSRQLVLRLQLAWAYVWLILQTVTKLCFKWNSTHSPRTLLTAPCSILLSPAPCRRFCCLIFSLSLPPTLLLSHHIYSFFFLAHQTSCSPLCLQLLPTPPLSFLSLFQKEKELLDDASNEAMLQMDEDGLRVKAGDCFFPISSEDLESFLAKVGLEAWSCTLNNSSETVHASLKGSWRPGTHFFTVVFFFTSASMPSFRGKAVPITELASLPIYHSPGCPSCSF